MFVRRHRYTPICRLPFHDACQTAEDEGALRQAQGSAERSRGACYAERMQPNLAQVLNTLAHEIRTPLAVSQGYLKLYLDGRLTNVDDTRRAFEQTRQALGALATLCVDMGKVSALSESAAQGIPERIAASDFVTSVRSHSEVEGACWLGEPAGTIETTNARDFAHAIAIVSK